MGGRWKDIWKRSGVFLMLLVLSAGVAGIPGTAAEPTAAETAVISRRETRALRLEKPLRPSERPSIEPEVVEPVEDAYFADAAFLGDSRTEGFQLYSGLTTGQYLTAVGATVESVFTKAVYETEEGKVPLLDALSELECSKVYIMLGVNELGWPRIEDYHDQYTKLVERVRQDHPDAAILLQSILPVSRRQDEKATYVNNRRIDEYNAVVEQVARETGCVYLDVAAAVEDEDGYLPKDKTTDGVHLNTAGCKVWLDHLRTHVAPAA